MTDGNTYAINKHLDEREDWDALQEVTAELEQAEARIEELEAYPGAWLEAEAQIIELEARVKDKERLAFALAADKIGLVSELAGVKGDLEKAVDALRPFAACADKLDEDKRLDGREWHDDEQAIFRLPVGYYRKARTALAAVAEPHKLKGETNE